MDPGPQQSLTSSITLLHLLSNSLVLYQTTPYLTPSSLLALGATSKSIRSLIFGSPGSFRRLDLTTIKSAKFELAAIDNGGEVWRNVQMDENVTEDDFYGGPLRGIFNKLRRQKILHHVQTLILDGLTVTSDLVCEIILHDYFNVRVLSIREVQHLNERKLQQALQYAVRPSRPENSPKLQALYIFGPREPSAVQNKMQSKSTQVIFPAAGSIVSLGGSIMHGQGAQIGAEWNQKSSDWLTDDMSKEDKWYQGSGKIFSKPISTEWETTLRACEGIISFDVVLCRGPRHDEQVARAESAIPWYRTQGAWLAPRAAVCSVRACQGCGSAPEGLAKFGKSPLDCFPLLAPPPLHASTHRAGKAPFADSRNNKFLARCVDCLRARYCESCHRWWCEDCYEIPDTAANTRSLLAPSKERTGNDIKPGVVRSCFECGMNCIDCIRRTQLMCNICGGGYCAIHNEGSTLTTAGRHAINGCRC